MSQQPDKLFREKLRGYERPVSGNAWERVSEHLYKTNSRNLWLKIAAAVLALVVAGGLLFLSVNKEPAPSLAVKTQPADPSYPALQAPGKAVTPERKQAPGRKNEMKIKSAPAPGRARDRKRKADVPAPEPSSLTSAKVAEVNPSANPEKKNPTVQDTPSPATTETEDRMTIIFSAQEVNDKYLEANEQDKKELADATSTEKKTSSFQSLLKKARDLKHNQDPLGDLRQKKNEILAFNFKPGRDHDQN